MMFKMFILLKSIIAFCKPIKLKHQVQLFPSCSGGRGTLGSYRPLSADSQACLKELLQQRHCFSNPHISGPTLVGNQRVGKPVRSFTQSDFSDGHV